MKIDYTAAESSILFINGEYWGIYSLRERHDEYYVENNYACTNPDLTIISYAKQKIQVPSGSIDYYEDLIDNISMLDPLSPDFILNIESMMDLDNLMDYFIAQVYLANTDWPSNNCEIWRFNNDTFLIWMLQ